MKIWHGLGIAAIVAAGMAGMASAQNTAAALSDEPFTPSDQATMIDGVHVACDGVGIDDRSQPQWNRYRLKIAFVGDKGQFLGNERISVTGNRHDISVHCEGPWALLDLPAGTYHVSADVWNAGHREFTARVGRSGQRRIVVRFPNAGGLVASNARAAQG
jgi:hypothetical protein